MACGKCLSIDITEMLSIERRISAGDRLAIDAVLAEAAEEIDRIRGELSEVLGEDRHTLARLAGIRAAKAEGCEAVICSSRWNKEAGRTDPAGKEPQRSGGDRRKATRATAGQRGKGAKCSS